MSEETDPESLREITAVHEAGHAVMRWVQGLPASEVIIHETGGFCAGTGRRQRVEALVLVALAGFVAETGCGFGGAAPNLTTSHSEDLDRVRELLRHATYLRIVGANAAGAPIFEAVDATVLRYWKRACEELWPYDDLIDDIAARLVERRRLSARSVAALCREFRKREKLAQ